MEFVIKKRKEYSGTRYLQKCERKLQLKEHIGYYKYSLVLEHWLITAITTICKWRLEALF